MTTNHSKGFYVFLGLTLIFFIGVIDFWVGKDIHFSYFYFIPISLVTWYVSETAGFFMSILSGISWTVNDIWLYPNNFISPISYINTFIQFSFLIVVVLALNNLKSNLDFEKTFARQDSLTGVFNRRAFYETIELELERSERYKRPFSLVYIDLDEFKAINDILGHDTGDQVLYCVGSNILQSIRKTDTLARLGGDEFAVLMPETEGPEAIAVMERVKSGLLKTMQKNIWFVTFSIGIASFTKPPQSVEEAIKNADRIMYVAKDQGKNTIKQENI
ncbi:MAG: hypothetical protein JM58_06160 [Peptococcaceae bacterium BICA1-8]|nr:MAG: hypothetical protein JM58_06160 [Peptococcaceae bacterium BICA1-8]